MKVVVVWQVLLFKLKKQTSKNVADATFEMWSLKHTEVLITTIMQWYKLITNICKVKFVS